MQQHRAFTQPLSREDRFAREAARLREYAELLRPGAEQEAAIRKARQLETASHMSEWLGSPGLQPPT